MKYANIVFMQGEDADEALKILDEMGVEEAYNYLQQWNYGESPIEENKNPDYKPWGLSDRLYKKDNYVMSYNIGLNYIGLTEIITE